jgi:flagellar biosynthetic protein FliP
MSLGATLGVVAALAFVLALLALTVWGLKRLGLARPGGARARLAVEVVQRVPLGPRTGIAVVRVGETVMAVSVGDGGVRPLFPVSELDRQRVVGSSAVPEPHQSSAAAQQAIDRVLAGGVTAEPIAPALPTPVVASVPAVAPTLPPPALGVYRADAVEHTPSAPASATPRQRALRNAIAHDASHRIETLFAIEDAAPPVTLSGRLAPEGRGLAEFQSVLRMALSGATRLAALALTVRLVLLPTVAGAQAAPAGQPAVPPASQPSVQPSVQPPTAPPALPAPTIVAPTTAAPAAAPARAPSTVAAPTPRVPSGPPARDTRGGTARPATTEAVVPGAPPRSETLVAPEAPTMSLALGNEQAGGFKVNGTVGVVLLMGMLTLLPTLVLMMTGFTRILIVLNFLKQAMGTQNAPPGQLVAALALILTGFVMAPTIEEANRIAITPWLEGRMEQMEMLKTGAEPFRAFMLAQVRESDLRTFVELSGGPAPATPADIPLVTLMSAFTASELRTAFQIGFAIYLPFIIIDTVVASVLMSMGMMMLPPAMVSMPFKLLLFVLVDGWALVVESLVKSFR